MTEYKENILSLIHIFFAWKGRKMAFFLLPWLENGTIFTSKAMLRCSYTDVFQLRTRTVLKEN